MKNLRNGWIQGAVIGAVILIIFYIISSITAIDFVGNDFLFIVVLVFLILSAAFAEIMFKCQINFDIMNGISNCSVVATALSNITAAIVFILLFALMGRLIFLVIKRK